MTAKSTIRKRRYYEDTDSCYRCRNPNRYKKFVNEHPAHYQMQDEKDQLNRVYGMSIGRMTRNEREDFRMGFKNFANENNYKSIFDIDISDMSFITLKELYEKNGADAIYQMDGAYINKKSSFGNHPVLICKEANVLVDLPQHQNNAVLALLNDSEAIEDVKAGKAGFSISHYIDGKFHRECYSVTWEYLGDGVMEQKQS